MVCRGEVLDIGKNEDWFVFAFVKISLREGAVAVFACRSELNKLACRVEARSDCIRGNELPVFVLRTTPRQSSLSAPLRAKTGGGGGSRMAAGV